MEKILPERYKTKQNKTKEAMNEMRLELNEIGKTFESHWTEKILPKWYET
jgi:hypothetical protein